jgi:hypothetical protein
MSEMNAHAVITLAIGWQGYWRWTHRVMARYADRIGADFIRITEEKRRVPGPLGYRLEKFQILDYLNQYERVIFLDGDIVIRPDCPDLFALTPTAELGAMCEGRFYRRDLVFAEAALFYGIELPVDPSEWFNSGVMVISQDQRSLFVEPARIELFLSQRPDGSRSPYSWIDMPLFNCQRILRDIRICDLGLRFNYLGSMKDQPNRPFEPEDAFIFHGSGGGKKHIPTLIKLWYGRSFYCLAYLLPRTGQN